MKKNKDIIICAIVLVVLVIFLICTYKGNDSIEKNNTNKEQTVEEQTIEEQTIIEEDNSIKIVTDEDLNNITNNCNFNKNIYSNTKDLLINESKYLLLSFESVLSEEDNYIDILSLSNEQIIYFTAILLSGEGYKVCFEKDYITSKVEEIFGIKDINYQEDSIYYNYSQDYICFEEVFLNLTPSSYTLNNYDDTDNIIIIISNDYYKYKFIYEKNTNHLLSIELIIE